MCSICEVDLQKENFGEKVLDFYFIHVNKHLSICKNNVKRAMINECHYYERTFYSKNIVKTDEKKLLYVLGETGNIVSSLIYEIINEGTLLLHCFFTDNSEEGLKLLERILKIECSEIICFNRYIFGYGWNGIPSIYSIENECLSKKGMKTGVSYTFSSNNIQGKMPFCDSRIKTINGYEIENKIGNYTQNIRLKLNGKLVGDADIWEFPKSMSNSGKRVLLEWIEIEEPHRKKGIGSAFINKIIEITQTKEIIINSINNTEQFYMKNKLMLISHNVEWKVLGDNDKSKSLN